MTQPERIVEEQLRRKLVEAFAPVHLELENESDMHNVPEGAESHFRMVLVSAAFRDLSLLDRQRKVQEVLAEEIAGPVHAFTQRTYTPEEWEKAKNEEPPKSPECLGGS